MWLAPDRAIAEGLRSGDQVNITIITTPEGWHDHHAGRMLIGGGGVSGVSRSDSMWLAPDRTIAERLRSGEQVIIPTRHHPGGVARSPWRKDDVNWQDLVTADCRGATACG